MPDRAVQLFEHQRRSFRTHPLEVVRTWARHVQERDVDAALRLYSPGATVHADGRDVTGRRHLKAYIESSPMFGAKATPDIRGEAGGAIVRWDGVGVQVRCHLDDGLVAEQWVDPVPAAARGVEVEREGAPLTMTVVTDGLSAADRDVGAIEYASKRMAVALAQIAEPILFARLKLSWAPDPAHERPAMAEIAVDVNGSLLRAHVAGHDLREAADLLQRRLRDKLEHRAERRESKRTRASAADEGEWRHGNVPTHRPEHFDRSPEERQLVRRKTLALDELTPDEAAFDMEQLDFDFQLFRELASGQDALLQRLDDGSYRLARLDGSTVDPGPTAIALAIDDRPAPVLSLDIAVERLDASGQPFVFFADVTTHRGTVLYRRYDGHYGVITAA